ncbi:pspC domain protein [Rhodococcus sp. MTM3W5.2]|uniref:PspC domain-containing protein n=1 Tax=Rhodococcus sp. MTM3W5.2 TaxID=1805827 RepID=UPI00097942B7|nr:PspC domain-containing protein [Rhodococcus sp. MTM3W5.2]AQA23168.1 pspC domain protein [Rhodococcus sp. MTM3W5.2]
MTTNETATPKSTFLQDLPQRLPDEGLIAGVSVGIARRLDVSTTSVRLALLLSLLLAGAGVPVYLAAWLLMRKPNETRSMGESLLSTDAGEPKTMPIVLATATVITAVGCALPVGAGLLGMIALVGGYLYLDGRK